MVEFTNSTRDAVLGWSTPDPVGNFPDLKNLLGFYAANRVALHSPESLSIENAPEIMPSPWGFSSFLFYLGESASYLSSYSWRPPYVSDKIIYPTHPSIYAIFNSLTDPGDQANFLSLCKDALLSDGIFTFANTETYSVYNPNDQNSLFSKFIADPDTPLEFRIVFTEALLDVAERLSEWGGLSGTDRDDALNAYRRIITSLRTPGVEDDLSEMRPRSDEEGSIFILNPGDPDPNSPVIIGAGGSSGETPEDDGDETPPLVKPLATGKHNRWESLVLSMAGNVICNCHCSLGGSLSTPQNPFWEMYFLAGTSEEDAQAKTEQLLDTLGIPKDEQLYSLEHNKLTKGWEVHIVNHDLLNHENRGDIVAAKKFCAENGLPEPMEESQGGAVLFEYLSYLAGESINIRYGFSGGGLHHHELQAVHHTSAETTLHFQNSASVYGPEESIVKFMDKKLTATKATNSTVPALIRAALAMQITTRAAGDTSFDTFNIKAGGVDLVITALAFNAARLELNAVTTAAVKAALADTSVMNKVKALAEKDPYLKGNYEVAFGPPELPPSAPGPSAGAGSAGISLEV